jgi:hypothetical protein
VDAPHEHGVIGLVECAELAIVNEPGGNAANARERDDLALPRRAMSPRPGEHSTIFQR